MEKKSKSTEVQATEYLTQAKKAGLTALEMYYFELLIPRSGVLWVQGPPGSAKSAIFKSIAQKMGWSYEDRRLSQIDETEVGLYPHVEKYNGNTCFDFIAPKWAHKSNEGPTLIHFEELNRSQLAVRNAALQILLDRQIGSEFKFNPNVFMVATGNLGKDDNCDVEELDDALNGRLIHVMHDMKLEDWKEGYANENVLQIFIDYLTLYPERIYSKAQTDDNTKAYASYRSWSNYSNMIKFHLGLNPKLNDIINIANRHGQGFIGHANVKFLNYLNDMSKLTIDDIINNYDTVESEVKKLPRARMNEYLDTLKTREVNKLNKNQYNNISKFLELLAEDARASYVLYVAEKYTEKDGEENSDFFDFYFDNFAREIEELISTYEKEENQSENKEAAEINFKK